MPDVKSKRYKYIDGSACLLIILLYTGRGADHQTPGGGRLQPEGASEGHRAASQSGECLLPAETDRRLCGRRRRGTKAPDVADVGARRVDAGSAAATAHRAHVEYRGTLPQLRIRRLQHTGCDQESGGDVGVSRDRGAVARRGVGAGRRWRRTDAKGASSYHHEHEETRCGPGQSGHSPDHRRANG